VQAVLLVGADINAKDIDGNTPCHFCSEYGHKDCLRYLLLKHPSLFSKNKEGLSPLDVAVNTEILSVSFNSIPLSVCRLSKNTSTVSRTLFSQISFRINQNSSTSKLLSQRKPPQLSDLQHQAVVVVALKHLNHNRN
jgi:ankyrin repeat protein